MLFASDEAVTIAQHETRRRAVDFKSEQERREFVDDQRELRLHQRMRLFAWLLFIAPVLATAIVTLISLLLPWIVGRIMQGRVG